MLSGFAATAAQDYWIGKYLGANRRWTGSPGVVALPTLSPPPDQVDSPSTVASSPPVVGVPATVVVPTLNLRAGPSKQTTIRRILKQGTQVDVFARNHDWYQVRTITGLIGWVIGIGIGSVTATISPGASPTPAPTAGVGTSPGAHYPHLTVPVDHLRVYTAPALSAAVIAVLRIGQPVDGLTQTHSWDRILTVNGTVGWSSAPLLEGRGLPAKVGTPVKALTPPARSAVVTATVRVHRQPGAQAPVITVARSGTVVAVVKAPGAWLLIRLPNSVSGYVLGSFVRQTPTAPLN